MSARSKKIRLVRDETRPDIGCAYGWRNTFKIPRRCKEFYLRWEPWDSDVHTVTSCIKVVRHQYSNCLVWETLNGGTGRASHLEPLLVPTLGEWAFWVEYE